MAGSRLPMVPVGFDVGSRTREEEALPPVVGPLNEVGGPAVRSLHREDLPVPRGLTEDHAVYHHPVADGRLHRASTSWRPGLELVEVMVTSSQLGAVSRMQGQRRRSPVPTALVSGTLVPGGSAVLPFVRRTANRFYGGLSAGGT